MNELSIHDPVRMEKGRMALTLFRLNATVPAGIVIASLIPMSAAALTTDVRFLILFFMGVFLLMPIAVGAMYFREGLRESTAFNTIPHYINMDDNGIVLQIAQTEESPDAGTPADYITDNCISRFYPWGRFTRILFDKDSILLVLAKPEGGFLWIPDTPATGGVSMSKTAENKLKELWGC